MQLVSALFGLVTLGGVALSVAPASAMPAGIGATASEAPYVQQAAYVCNDWGNCWHQHNYGVYYHPHYYGGWGYGGWHHWHHWNQW